jgi:hypothetical protein
LSFGELTTAEKFTNKGCPRMVQGRDKEEFSRE